MFNYFDVVIIGSGPAGYTASIRCSQLGMKTACVDNWINLKKISSLGGTCTNVGCIPSKILLQSSENYKFAKNKFNKYGIEFKNLYFNLKKTLNYKNNIIKKINNGIKFLFKKNNIYFFHGTVYSFKKNNNYYLIKISNKKKKKIIYSKHIIIATGSKSKRIFNIPFDEKYILSNIGGLSINKKIEKLGIIGAGIIGLEIGSIWNRLGVNITILENSSIFLNITDKDISKKAYKILTNQGLNIHLNIKILKIKINKKKVLIKYILNNKIIYSLFDKIIVSIGREANIDFLNIKKNNIKLNNLGFISVNKKYQTNLKNIWAIGDVIGGYMLAHKAEEEGITVSNNILGIFKEINYNLIPFVIYTSPEIAWVGYNENQLISLNIPYKFGIFPFLANSRAIILENKLGIIKIISHKENNKILGIHIIGHLASELISNAVIALKFNASFKDLINICYAHPSLTEIIKEASMNIENSSINL